MFRVSAATIVLVAVAACHEPVDLPRDKVQPRPRGIYVPIAPLSELTAPEHVTPTTGDPPRVIYMNRDGGVFSPGSNNSSTNRSTIVDSTVSIPAWDVSDSGWDAIMECMQEMYAPYNIIVTDIDPGDTPHVESVVAGHPSDLGFPSGVGGVSPFSCGVIERSIVFTFAEIYGSVQGVCETAAQETAHSYGLDHEYLCEDPMTYLSGCGPKTFQDVNAQCGEYSPRSCNCGGSTQNSHEVLLARLGPARPPDDPGDPPDDPTGDPDAGPPPPPPDPDAAPPDPTSPDAAPDPMDPPDDPSDDPNDPPDDPGDPPDDPADPGDDPGPTDGEGDTRPGLVGGCSTAATGRGGAAGALLLLGLLLAIRRRT